MNELAKRNDTTYAQRYEVTDPYAAFAAEGGPGIVGKPLACKKGDWSLGSDGDPVPAEARFLFVVLDTMMRGWLKWHDGRVVDAEMGYVQRPLSRQASLLAPRFSTRRVGEDAGWHASRSLGAVLSRPADRGLAAAWRRDLERVKLRPPSRAEGDLSDLLFGESRSTPIASPSCS